MLLSPDHPAMAASERPYFLLPTGSRRRYRPTRIADLCPIGPAPSPRSRGAPNRPDTPFRSDGRKCLRPFLPLPAEAAGPPALPREDAELAGRGQVELGPRTPCTWCSPAGCRRSPPLSSRGSWLPLVPSWSIGIPCVSNICSIPLPIARPRVDAFLGRSLVCSATCVCALESKRSPSVSPTRVECPRRVSRGRSVSGILGS